MSTLVSESQRDILFDVQNLNVGFATVDGYKPVVHNFNLRLHKGETVAIVGESGSGKTVATRALLGLVGDNAVVSAEVLRYREQSLLAATRVNGRPCAAPKSAMSCKMRWCRWTRCNRCDAKLPKPWTPTSIWTAASASKAYWSC